MSDTLDPQRRDFLKTASAAAATALTSDFFVHASDKSGTRPVVIGSGEFTYECHHNWGAVPDHIKWHATHGVAIDEAGLIYITHRAPFNSNIDTVTTFEPSGKFVRSFGKQWNFGGHGIDIRKDGSRFPVDVKISAFVSHGEAVMLSAVRDITDRKRMEEALRRSRTQLSDILENNPAVVYTRQVGNGWPHTFLTPNIYQLLGKVVAF